MLGLSPPAIDYMRLLGAPARRRVATMHGANGSLFTSTDPAQGLVPSLRYPGGTRLIFPTGPGVRRRSPGTRATRARRTNLDQRGPHRRHGCAIRTRAPRVAAGHNALI